MDGAWRICFQDDSLAISAGFWEASVPYLVHLPQAERPPHKTADFPK